MKEEFLKIESLAMAFFVLAAVVGYAYWGSTVLAHRAAVEAAAPESSLAQNR